MLTGELTIFNILVDISRLFLIVLESFNKHPARILAVAFDIVCRFLSIIPGSRRCRWCIFSGNLFCILSGLISKDAGQLIRPAVEVGKPDISFVSPINLKRHPLHQRHRQGLPRISSGYLLFKLRSCLQFIKQLVEDWNMNGVSV